MHQQTRFFFFFFYWLACSRHSPSLKQALLHISFCTQSNSYYLLFVSCFQQLEQQQGDRLWQFAMPITLTTIYRNTLFPVAFFQSFSFLVCAFLGPHVGNFVDRFSRLFVASSSLIAQNVCVALSAVAMGVLLTIDQKDFDQTKPYLYYFPFSTWYAFVLFMVSMIFNSLSAISAMSSQVSKMKDWAVVVAKAYQRNLADVNATIRRIDLICNIVAPVAYALLESFTTVRFTCVCHSNDDECVQVQLKNCCFFVAFYFWF